MRVSSTSSFLLKRPHASNDAPDSRGEHDLRATDGEPPPTTPSSPAQPPSGTRERPEPPDASRERARSTSGSRTSRRRHRLSSDCPAGSAAEANGAVRARPRLNTEGSPTCAQPGCLYGDAAASGARAAAHTYCMPHTRQVTGEITNTPLNTWVPVPLSCYSYCMISPIRGNRTGIRVQVPLGHVKSP